MKKYHLELANFIKKNAMWPMLVAIIVALLLNSVVAYIAVINGASSSFQPLTPQLYGAFTILGFIGGWVGWRVVELNAKNPQQILRILVPIVTILSFAPDTLLALTRFIPDTSLTGVFGLMVMHLVVIGCAVPSFVAASRRFKA